MIKLSIIVPIFKVEKYVRKCIESLLGQSFSAIEIILVDDGSPDKSGAICEEYAKNDSRIKVIHQKNKGVSAARNAGLSIANGEFIGFVDPDDWIQADMYEEMINAFSNPEVDLVACGYNYYDENYTLDANRIYLERPNELLDRLKLYKIMSDIPPTIRHGVWSKCFRRSICDKLNLKFDETLRASEDLDFLLTYMTKVKKTIFIHKPLYNNLVREGSATHGGLNIKSLNDSFRIHERMYYDTIKEFPYLKGYAIAFLIDVLMLKYKESKKKVDISSKEQLKMLYGMRSIIRKYAIKALASKHIYWKTKIAYSLLWILK